MKLGQLERLALEEFTKLSTYKRDKEEAIAEITELLREYHKKAVSARVAFGPEHGQTWLLRGYEGAYMRCLFLLTKDQELINRILEEE